MTVLPLPSRRLVARHHMLLVSPDEFREVVTSRAELRPCEFGLAPTAPTRSGVQSASAQSTVPRRHSVLLADDEVDALERARAKFAFSRATAAIADASHRPRGAARDADSSFGCGSVTTLRHRVRELYESTRGSPQGWEAGLRGADAHC